MSDELKRFNEFVDWFWLLVFGTERRKSEESEFTNVDKGFSKDEVKAWKTWSKPKRPPLPKKDAKVYTGRELMSKEKIDMNKMRKKDIKVIMDKLSIKYNSGDTKADLLQKFKWGSKE